MGYARVRLSEVRQVVFRKAQRIKRCKCCGHDIDYSSNECCKSKRQSRGRK